MFFFVVNHSFKATAYNKSGELLQITNYKYWCKTLHSISFAHVRLDSKIIRVFHFFFIEVTSLYLT
jgi:hypothetical protein